MNRAWAEILIKKKNKTQPKSYLGGMYRTFQRGQNEQRHGSEKPGMCTGVGVGVGVGVGGWAVGRALKPGR